MTKKRVFLGIKVPFHGNLKKIYALAKCLENNSDKFIETIDMNSFNLIESTLGKNGPVYNSLKEFSLNS